VHLPKFHALILQTLWPTAAHRSLPFGTKVRVTNLANQKSVVVVINDRGPRVRGRVLDLSLAAARSLGMTDRGVADVRGEVL
jgi:rare lipoprotein A